MSISTLEKPSILASQPVRPAPAVRLMHLCLSLDMGGAEMLAVQMTNDQAERFAVPPTLAALARSDNPLLPARVAPSASLRVLDMCGGLKYPTLQRLRRLVQSARIEVIHAHNPSPLLAATLACVGLPVRVLYTHHGSGVPAVFNKHPLLRNWLIRKTTAFVGVSPEATSKLQEAFAGKIPISRLHTILNGIPASETRGGDSGESISPLPEYKGFTLGYVGRLAVEKRVNLLIEAVAALRAAGIECRLAVIGDGELRGELEAQTARLHLTDHILFLGVRSDVSRLLSEFDLFVNASYTEGISLSILEAMMAGLPIVATAVGGTPLLIENGVSGQLVEPESTDALVAGIASLLLSAERRREYGTRAQRNALERFSFRAMMDKYEALYTQ